MPGPEECFESKQALNARFRESNRNISPIEKDYHTNLKECKNDILFIAYEIKDQYDNGTVNCMKLPGGKDYCNPICLFREPVYDP